MEEGKRRQGRRVKRKEEGKMREGRRKERKEIREGEE